MSNKAETTKKAAKRTGLGRGLGSLLGGGDDFDRDNNNKGQSQQKPASKSFSAQANPSLKEGFVEKKQEKPSSGKKDEQAQAKPQEKVAPRVPDHARIWQIPIDKIAGNPKQPRQSFEKEALEELANSIKAKGILQPIVARRQENGKFQIIAGERRWRAAQMAGVHEVPVILKKSGDQDSLELALIENIQREDLNPIEEAEAYAHLMKNYSLTQQQLAEKMGKERATVANVLRLLNLMPAVRQMVANCEISLGQAKILLGVSDPKVQKSLAEEVKKKKLTVRDTEKLVARANKPKEELQSTEMSSDKISNQLIQSLSQDLQKTLGTRVAIDYSEGKGKLKIHFYSDDDLNNLVENIKEAWQK